MLMRLALSVVASRPRSRPNGPTMQYLGISQAAHSRARCRCSRPMSSATRALSAARCLRTAAGAARRRASSSGCARHAGTLRAPHRTRPAHSVRCSASTSAPAVTLVSQQSGRQCRRAASAAAYSPRCARGRRGDRRRRLRRGALIYAADAYADGLVDRRASHDPYRHRPHAAGGLAALRAARRRRAWIRERGGAARLRPRDRPAPRRSDGRRAADVLHALRTPRRGDRSRAARRASAIKAGERFGAIGAPPDERRLVAARARPSHHRHARRAVQLQRRRARQSAAHLAQLCRRTRT